jgi:putative membrane protein
MEPDKRRVLEEIGAGAPRGATALPVSRVELDAQSFVEADADANVAPGVPGVPAPRRRHRLLAGALGAAGLLGLVQTGVLLWEQARESPLLGGAWLIVGGVVLSAATGAVLREWRRLRRIRQRRDARSLAEEMLAREGIGQAAGFCEALARDSGVADSAGYARWSGVLEQTHNNREVLTLYRRFVLAQSDRLALASVVKRSGDTAVAVALSPFAALDMLLMLWRNLRMFEEITAAYGVDTGYWGRIALLRDMLRNIALAGAAEIAAEVGMDILGAGMTARVSTRAAQGLGAGLLTARLGLRAMDACRPIPWTPGERPRLADVRNSLLGVVGEYARSS